MTTTHEEHTWTTIQNTCYCESWNDETGEWEDTVDCFGCWEMGQEDFDIDTKPLFDSDNFTGWWKIEGFPVWYGTTGGLFQAKNDHQLLDAITPNHTEWNLRYRIEGETLVGKLSHHDGSGTITVTMIPDPEGE